MEKVLIFGGTGFIGLSLAAHLKENGLKPILIARNKPTKLLDFKFHQWDSQTVGQWKILLNNSLAIVNLAGKSVDCIKSPDNCDLILRSRVDSTLTIGKAFQEVKNPPKVWVQMSTAHIYGDPPSQICTEESTTGVGLAPFVGIEWEKAFNKAKPQNVIGIILRTSFVIGKNGGALANLIRIVKLGLGGTVAKGNQGISWIHQYDLNEIILQSIINQEYQGTYVTSAPNPVSNKKFMKLLRKIMKVPFGISSPEMIVRIGAKFIFKTDPELAIYGRYVKSKRLKLVGYQFKFTTLEQALKNLLKK